MRSLSAYDPHARITAPITNPTCRHRTMNLPPHLL
jgi:hypothetical protein